MTASSTVARVAVGRKKPKGRATRGKQGGVRGKKSAARGSWRKGDAKGGKQGGVRSKRKGEAKPHDGLFKHTFGDPAHLAGELQSVLAPEVLAELDL